MHASYTYKRMAFWIHLKKEPALSLEKNPRASEIFIRDRRGEKRARGRVDGYLLHARASSRSKWNVDLCFCNNQQVYIYRDVKTLYCADGYRTAGASISGIDMMLALPGILREISRLILFFFFFSTRARLTHMCMCLLRVQAGKRKFMGTLRTLCISDSSTRLWMFYMRCRDSTLGIDSYAILS